MEDPRGGAARRPGAPLTAHERALLERLCAGAWPGAPQARAQLPAARWGGKDHDGDACFLVDVAPGAGLPDIPPHGGGPIATLDVVDGSEALGLLELWVRDGRLHSVDYSTFAETAATALPEMDQLAGP